MNPRFRRQQSDSESQPECRAEKLLRRQSTSGEEQTNDGSCCGDTKGNAESSDHPLPVPDDPALPDIPKSHCKKKEEQNREQRRGGGLVRAAYCHRETHHQRRRSNHESQHDQKSPGPAVPCWMLCTNAPDELQRHHDDEHRGGEDVQKGEEPVCREARVERCSRGEP